MQYYKVLSLPKVLFAHRYECDGISIDHSHARKNVEITYIEKGYLNIQVGEDIFLAETGDVICQFYRANTAVFTDEVHAHRTVGAEMNWSLSEDTSADLLLPLITPAKNIPETVYNLIDEIIRKQVQYRDSSAKGAAKFLELLCAIDKCNRQIQDAKIPGEQLYTQNAKKYIQQNIFAPITQIEIAEHLGISPEYLCTVFKRIEGTTIKRYINCLKLECVKSLIDNKGMHLYEAAAIYGYNDPNYVSRLYRQLFGGSITNRP